MQEGRRVQLLARVRPSSAMLKSPFWQRRLGWDGLEWTGSRFFALADVLPCFYFALLPPLLFLLSMDSVERRWMAKKGNTSFSATGRVCLVVGFYGLRREKPTQSEWIRFGFYTPQTCCMRVLY